MKTPSTCAHWKGWVAAISLVIAQCAGAADIHEAAVQVTASVATADPRWTQLEHSRWIADGRDDAPRKVYAFTDPNCPYCTKLWSDARPWVQSGKLQLRHVIVGILTPTSEGKAAAILMDKDPAAKLAAYESSHAFAVVRMLATQRAHPVEDDALKPPAEISAATHADLAANLRLMESLGIRATPGVAFLDASGKLETRQGLSPGAVGIVFGPR